MMRNPADCGEGGIRTHGTGLRYTRSPGVPLRPLGHLSVTHPLYGMRGVRVPGRLTLP